MYSFPVFKLHTFAMDVLHISKMWPFGLFITIADCSQQSLMTVKSGNTVWSTVTGLEETEQASDRSLTVTKRASWKRATTVIQKWDMLWEWKCHSKFYREYHNNLCPNGCRYFCSEAGKYQFTIQSEWMATTVLNPVFDLKRRSFRIGSNYVMLPT